MKTAEDYYQEAVDNWDITNQQDPSDNYPLEPFIISAMESYAKELRAYPTWRLIETAPKDGTEVLLYTKDGFAHAKWTSTYSSGEHWHGVVEDWVINTNQDYPYIVESPTHWMPLPPPPNA